MLSAAASAGAPAGCAMLGVHLMCFLYDIVFTASLAVVFLGCINVVCVSSFFRDFQMYDLRGMILLFYG